MANRNSRPPWSINPLSLIVLIVTIGAGVFLSKTLGLLPYATMAYAVGAALLVVVSAAVAGAVVARLSASRQLVVAERQLAESMQQLQTEAATFLSAVQTISALPAQCDGHRQGLVTAIHGARDIVRAALAEVGQSLITYRELGEIEASVRDGADIWILTSALQLEYDELRGIIQQNLGRGVKYTYLIPDDNLLRRRFTQLTKDWQPWCSGAPEEQIRCFLVPRHFSYMTVCIYDALRQPATVLVKFPTSRIYDKQKYPLVYRVAEQPEEAWRTFVNAFADMIAEPPKCQNTEALELGFSAEPNA